MLKPLGDNKYSLQSSGGDGMDPVLGTMILSGVMGLVGNIFQGQAAEENLDKQLGMKQKELDAQVKQWAIENGISEEKLRDARDQAIANLRETARQFDKGMAFKESELALTRVSQDSTIQQNKATANSNLALAGQTAQSNRMDLRAKARGQSNVNKAWSAVPPTPGPSPSGVA